MNHRSECELKFDFDDAIAHTLVGNKHRETHAMSKLILFLTPSYY